MSEKRNTYYRVVTQEQVPDFVIKNITMITIDKEGILRYFYRIFDNKKNDWQVKNGQFQLGAFLQVRNYTKKYMLALTQGKVKKEVLKTIQNIHISDDILLFTYMPFPGMLMNGRIHLEGLK